MYEAATKEASFRSLFEPPPNNPSFSAFFFPKLTDLSVLIILELPSVHAEVYKHSTSGPPEASDPWRPTTFQSLGGTGMGLQRLASSEPTLLSLSLLCASCLSAWLDLASNSFPDASTLPPSMAQARLPAHCHWVASEGRSPLCRAPSLLPEGLWRPTECEYWPPPCMLSPLWLTDWARLNVYEKNYTRLHRLSS